MENVKSGKELCDDFFKGLSGRKDIDSKIVALVQDLYEAGYLTKNRLRAGLDSLRQEIQNDQQGEN